MSDGPGKPVGRDAVKAALIDATTELILEHGVTLSVPDIARRADVDPAGFPPADLAFRRGGEVAFARVMLEVDDDPFPSHPILPGWRTALAATRPDATDAELDAAVIIATTLGLGWALFADVLGDILGVDSEGSDAIERRVLELVAEIGGLPATGASTSPTDPSSD